MKTRLFQGIVFLVVMAAFAAPSIAGSQLQPSNQKYAITLENGKILKGEIVAVTATTISIKDEALGVVAITRDNIVKIDPPLDEEKPEAEARPTPPPAPAVRYADQPYVSQAGGDGLRIGFSLSGGLGFIDGGDFNAYIRDMNLFAADYNNYWDGDDYLIDWKEMKSMMNFGGEVFARFGRYFGVGLGVDYISKNNPGIVDLSWDDSNRTNYSSYYLQNTYTYDSVEDISQKLSVIPITFSLYGYLPLGRSGEIYAKAGAGYYLGTLETTIDQSWKWVDNYDWFLNNDTEWPPQYHDEAEGTETDYYKATSSTVGFHFGLGFNFNLTNNIAVFGEALYRLANFKNWEGSGEYDYLQKETYGWTDETPTVETTTEGDSWNGKGWYYLDFWPEYDNEYYAKYGLYKNAPEEDTYTSDIRPAEININGFSFRVGIKISFALGGRR